MKRTAILTIVLVLVAATVIRLSQERRPSSSGVVLQFLGTTNDPALGASALLCLNNGSGRLIAFTSPFMETKSPAGWTLNPDFPRWKMGGGPELGGQHVSVNFSLHGKGKVVFVVAQPKDERAWRVGFNGAKTPLHILRILNEVTWGLSDRLIGGNLVSVTSPAMRD